MFALLSPFLGIIGSLLPEVLRFFTRGQELKHELELKKLEADTNRQKTQADLDAKAIDATVAEGQSLRTHDAAIDGGKFLNALRASIRPVITYAFFGLFVAVKVSAAYVMLKTGQSVPAMLSAVWDQETMSLFSTIIAFWFGTRIFEKRDEWRARK